MLTMVECTSIPDGYDYLFDQSLPHMEAGTFDWGIVGNPVTYEAKKAAVREQFESFIDGPITKVTYWEKDGHPIEMAAGVIHPYDLGYISWEFVIYGADASGSKSWMHDVAYLEITRDYIRDDLGLLGHKASCVEGGSVHAFQMNRTGADGIYTVETESTNQTEFGVSIATLKFTYL
jgi:hypothetical protein